MITVIWTRVCIEKNIKRDFFADFLNRCRSSRDRVPQRDEPVPIPGAEDPGEAGGDGGALNPGPRLHVLHEGRRAEGGPAGSLRMQDHPGLRPHPQDPVAPQRSSCQARYWCIFTALKKAPSIGMHKSITWSWLNYGLIVKRTIIFPRI